LYKIPPIIKVVMGIKMEMIKFLFEKEIKAYIVIKIIEYNKERFLLSLGWKNPNNRIKNKKAIGIKAKGMYLTNRYSYFFM